MTRPRLSISFPEKTDFVDKFTCSTQQERRREPSLRLIRRVKSPTGGRYSSAPFFTARIRAWRQASASDNPPKWSMSPISTASSP